MNKIDILNQCTIEGTVVKLPNVQLERKLYEEVAKSLNGIGGKWEGGKTAGFVFSADPTELLQKIAGGDNINLKKDFQFFGTPSFLANHMAQLIRYEDNMRILEPSAGQGALVEALLNNWRLTPSQIDCIELMPQNRDILKQKGYTIIAEDFLTYESNNLYDAIIANPPFANNQDIAHIEKMYRMLKKGGTLITLSSKHWTFASNSKETKFRNWLKEVNAVTEEVPAGTFKESGTNIPTIMICIDK